MDNARTISLPEDICRTAETRFAHRFGGIEELLTAVLSQLLHEDALKMDEREQQIIEERLKGLGYI